MNRPSYLLFKKCNKCGEILHISKFYKKQTGKYGVDSICKKCQNNQNKEYGKKYKENNKDKIKKYNKEYKKNNKDKILKYHKEYNKEYYEDNKEYYKEYREDNKDKIREYNKKYYEDNKEYYKEYYEEYYENNPEKFFNQRVKRRIKENTQGNGITNEQWYEMMEFFNWECAYSGIQLTKDKRTIDHIVALDNGGEHEIWNCIPCYASYNYSKHTKNMLDWYLQQEYFNVERLTKIYEWRIYAYWKWNKKESV